MRLAILVLSTMCLMTPAPRAQYAGSAGAPETFSVNAQVKGPTGAAAAVLQVVIERYTPDAERKAIEDALATGGYTAFVSALRKSAPAGYVQLGTVRVPIRYARDTRHEKKRTIELVTERPIAFLGGEALEPKPRAGFEVAVLRMEVDFAGFGFGEMAAAARVEPAPGGGVQIEDYADEPIRLITVRRHVS